MMKNLGNKINVSTNPENIGLPGQIKWFFVYIYFLSTLDATFPIVRFLRQTLHDFRGCFLPLTLNDSGLLYFSHLAQKMYSSVPTIILYIHSHLLKIRYVKRYVSLV